MIYACTYVVCACSTLTNAAAVTRTISNATSRLFFAAAASVPRALEFSSKLCFQTSRPLWMERDTMNDDGIHEI